VDRPLECDEQATHRGGHNQGPAHARRDFATPISGVDAFDSITGTARASTPRWVSTGIGSAGALMKRGHAPRKRSARSGWR
jgi:hypothetical protein